MKKGSHNGKGGINAYARHRKEKGLSGTDPMTVQEAVRRGRIKRDAEGYIDFAQADKDWAQNTTPAVPRSIHRTDGIAEEEDAGAGFNVAHYTKARAAREYYMACLAKIELDERRGNVLPKAEVQVAAFNQYRGFRDRLLNIPDRVAAIIAAETNAKKCHEILLAEIRRALNDFAADD